MKDTAIPIDNKMLLTIQESRQTARCHAYKEGFEEVSSETRTRFYWKLCGIASKLGPAVVESDGFDAKEQEVYDVAIRSEGFGLGCFSGFKSREKAIENAVAFAERNGITVDGYKLRKS